jgi:hypothetical protein
MLHVADMKEGTNDNSTWTTLGLHALRLTERLEEQRPEDERETKPEKTVEQQREHERFIEAGLRRIERFELVLRDGAKRAGP